MSQVLQGGTLTRVYSDLVLDPKYGPSTREVWRGQRASLLALSATYSSLGFRVDYSDNEGAAQLTVTLPQGNDPSVSETPADTWEVITESDQQSVWQNKRVFDAARSRAGATFTADDVIANWRRRIANALAGKATTNAAIEGPTEFVELNENSREPLTPHEAGFSLNEDAFLYRLYVKFLRGEEQFEFRRVSLRLSRVVTANYAGRAVLDPIEKVYTTVKLQSTFSVPASVIARLPANPPANLTPTATAWSWKLRQDGYQILLSTNKVQETKDWIFGAWDTDLYELVQ